VARDLYIIKLLYICHLPKYFEVLNEYIPNLSSIEETKTRILFVAPYMSMGGAEKVVLDLARSLDRKKYVVDIVSITNNPDRSNLWRELYAEVADHLWHIPDLIHRAFRSGFLYHIARIRKYDVVLMSHAIIYIDTLTPVLRIFPESKRYCIIHDVYPDWSFDVARYDFFWNKYICVCPFAAQLLTELKGIPPAKIEVIPNGVDTNQFDPICFCNNFYRNKFRIMPDDKLVAFVARMNPIKHPEYVIKLARLMKEIPHIRFVMAGDGPMLEEITQMIHSEGLQESVFMLGAVDDVAQLMSEIDLLYHCAESEAFGLCILEAMAMGKPAVVPRSEGIPEFFEDGVNGIMLNFDEDFIENSKKAILHILLEEPTDKYRVVNRKKAEFLSLETQVKHYEALF